MKWNQSNDAAKLVALEPREGNGAPQLALEAVGTCEVRPVTGEDLLSARSRELLGELGHDLRMPLSAISMGIQLVQRDVPAKAEILLNMRSTLQRMYRLIEQLLRMARSGTGELVLKRERVSLAEICQEVIDEASLAYPGHPIEFENWADAPGEWDRDRLLQVVQNLVSNALSHGAAGEPIIVSVFDCGEEAVLAVANRGQAVPNPVREQLLDRTRHGAWSYDHLGLYIVKEIVHAHAGRIVLTSDDSPTVFQVWLPKKRENSVRRGAAKLNDHELARSRLAGLIPSQGEA